MSHSPWSENDIIYLKANYLSLPYDKIAQHLGRTVGAVKARVHILGIPLKHKRVSVNHHYFDTIDCPTKAYFLGLLAADGHVAPRSTSGYCVRLSLRQGDEATVGLLRDEIAPGKRLYYYENMCLLDVTSEHMANTLMCHYDIKTNRKPTIIMPKLTSHLQAPFILGYFDGDGWITRNKHGTWTWGLMGGKPLLDDMVDCFSSQLNITLSLHTYDSWAEPDWMYRIMAYAAKAQAIDFWLHGLGLGIPRKNIVWRDMALIHAPI